MTGLGRLYNGGLNTSDQVMCLSDLFEYYKTVLLKAHVFGNLCSSTVDRSFFDFQCRDAFAMVKLLRCGASLPAGLSPRAVSSGWIAISGVTSLTLNVSAMPTVLRRWTA